MRQKSCRRRNFVVACQNCAAKLLGIGRKSFDFRPSTTTVEFQIKKAKT
jgi:hypothetical protein